MLHTYCALQPVLFNLAVCYYIKLQGHGHRTSVVDMMLDLLDICDAARPTDLSSEQLKNKGGALQKNALDELERLVRL